MVKKASITILVLLMILTLASMTALARKGGPGGEPPVETPPVDIPITGSLYGDLYVILRNEDGIPLDGDLEIYDPEEEGSCIQPIAASWEDGLCELDPDDEFVECGTIDYGTEAEPDVRKWVVVDYDYLGHHIYDATITEGEPFSPVYFVFIDEPNEVEIEFDCELSAGDEGDPENPDDDVTFFDLSMFVQAVDFGRLNLGRAPDPVIEHAFDESVKKFNNACFMRLDPAGRIMYALAKLDDETPCADVYDVDWFTIDSPAENIALYIKMLTDGHWITTDTDKTQPGGGGGGGGGGRDMGDGSFTEPRPVLDESAIALISGLGYPELGNAERTTPLTSGELLLASSLLAGGAGKAGNITLDLVIYINAIYGITGDSPFPMYQYREGMGRDATYGEGTGRSSFECGASRPGFMWVLEQQTDPLVYQADCFGIMSHVHYVDYLDDYKTVGLTFEYDENIRGFAQAADDALQTLEYIHNYRVPADLYADDYVGE